MPTDVVSEFGPPLPSHEEFLGRNCPRDAGTLKLGEYSPDNHFDESDGVLGQLQSVQR